MAIDTADKRASVIGLGLIAWLVLPSPGAIDQPDRQHVTYSYRGIAATAAVAIEGDLVTTANAIFARTVTSERGVYARTLTADEAVFARTVTSADAER